jgi:glycosyltransferase involved in cell wall biosynthesis
MAVAAGGRTRVYWARGPLGVRGHVGVQHGSALRMSRVVHHFGPDSGQVGGMASVIRILAEHRLGGDAVTVHPTWREASPFTSALLAMRAAARILRLGASDVVHVHLSEDGAFVREGMLVALARSLRKATVVTIHGANFLPFADRRPWLAAGVLKRAHVITCLDRDVLRRVQQLAPRAHVELVPNPVAIDDDAPGADQTEEIVLFAGEIGLRKGADVLWRAWRIVKASRPRARCFMVGPVNDFEVPATERLEMRPPVGPSELRCLLRSARVVALPSRAEGMPMILTEAMGCGRPFVSTAVGGIPDLAHGGGVLVDVGDEPALARRLTELLEDPALAHSIGEQGRSFCRATRSIEVIDARLCELYAAAEKEAA